MKRRGKKEVGSIALGVGAALLLGAMLLAGSAPAGELDDGFSTDSEITLIEKAGNQTLTVSIATRDGRTTLASDRSGSVKTAAVTESDCTALWEGLMALPIDELESATPKAAFPDSAEFTLTLRVGETSHSLTVYDVDSLEDERYRSAIRSILALESETMAAPAQG